MGREAVIAMTLALDGKGKVDRRRATGSYFTPESLANFMADWAIRSGTERVLEPSFGGGVFLDAVSSTLSKFDVRQTDRSIVTGVEIDQKVAGAYRVKDPRRGIFRSINADFMDIEPFPVDVVIGNPPFVRFRNLPAAQASVAKGRAEAVLGGRVESSGSLWLPFLLHAVKFLTLGGRLAFVLPYEMTHVRYARPVWKWLGGQFGKIELIRLHERAFDDILQDVVVVLCENRGRQTDSVEFSAYETLGDFGVGAPATNTAVAIADVVDGQRSFTRALLSVGLRDFLSGSEPWRPEIQNLAAVNIGYVTGDKTFFHPSREAVAKFGIPVSSLRGAVTSSRSLSRTGLWSSTSPSSDAVLFSPSADEEGLTDGELEYIRQGERDAVDQRYKCRIRDPWWRVPGVRTPDFILSVFSTLPRMMVNDSGLAASNSLLCGFVGDETSAESLVASWYTSLSLLEAELNVHALGGGVLVLIPGEVARIRLPKPGAVNRAHLETLDELLRAGNVEKALEAGDQEILSGRFKLDSDLIESIRDGVATLKRWRVR